MLEVNLAGSQVRTFKFDDIGFGRSEPIAKPDYDGDTVVDFADYAAICAGERDMDGDGAFGVEDLGQFCREWTRRIPAKAGYEFVWSDEFDGVELDYTNWTHEVGPIDWNGELQFYSERQENSYVQDGKLVIVAREEQYGNRDYTSARIYSYAKQNFLYGRMEARIKNPKGQGMWPAFWMMPTESVYSWWPSSGEVDIMEGINQMEFSNAAIHFASESGEHLSSGYQLPARPGTDYSQNYYIYAIEWEPNEIRWSVNGGIPFFSETEWSSWSHAYPAPFNQPFHFILNLAVGGGWPGPPDETTVFPKYMYIDWVRVYRKSE
jgi:beta-glucanase (GH16 family)